MDFISMRVSLITIYRENIHGMLRIASIIMINVYCTSCNVTNLNFKLFKQILQLTNVCYIDSVSIYFFHSAFPSPWFH